jgi:hypothetical protein
VSWSESPPGACAPLAPAHDYDGDAYAFAKHEDAVADAIGKAFVDAGGGASGAAAAADAFASRREALARDYHALCGALPSHVGDSMMRTLQMKTGFAIHKVCSTLPKDVSDPAVRASLAQLCEEFCATLGQGRLIAP